jgi:hypothetical protein
MDCKNDAPSAYRDDVSPYLLRPLRSYAEACRDIAARQQMLRRARIANDNIAIDRILPGATPRRGDTI